MLKAEDKLIKSGASPEAVIEAANAAAAEAIEKEEEPEEEAEEPNSPDEKSEAGDDAADYHLSNARTAPDEETRQAQRLESIKSRTSQLTRESTRRYTSERLDVENQIEVAKTKSIALMPTKTADGTILVDWYTTDDPANPQNWTPGRKWLALAQLAAYSMSVYGASSMYVPG